MLGLNHVRRKSQNCRGIVGELGGPSQDGRASELHTACKPYNYCSVDGVACDGAAGWSALSKPGWYERSFKYLQILRISCIALYRLLYVSVCICMLCCLVASRSHQGQGGLQTPPALKR